MQQITHSQYKELLEQAKKLNPKVSLNCTDIDNEPNTLYFKSKEGISYLKGKGMLGGLARFKKGNENLSELHQMYRIQLGGNYLECFDGKLVELYKRQGFYIVARLAFNPFCALDGWQKDDDLRHEPDIVFMSLDKKEIKYFENYDRALAYSISKVKFLCRLYRPQGDKDNIYRDTLNESLDLLGVKLWIIKSITSYLNCTDLHFLGTNNYIRIIK